MPRRYEGTRKAYTIDFPDGWYRQPVDDDGGAAFDLHAFRPFRGAAFMVESVEAPAPFAWRPLEESLLDAIRDDDRLELVERKLEGARTVTLRAEVHGEQSVVEVIAALHRVDGRVVMLRAFAPRPAFVALEQELRNILHSFAVSP
jgi:hypothetical protein